ncbi:MAG: hypothetical protein EAZ07_03325 [Cytophagales bacterium]|nr:MAG: hypothetical protein EAZ07_03325 [Cytophagales bacterium]
MYHYTNYKKQFLLALFFLIFLGMYSCIPYKKTLLLREKNSKYKDTLPTYISQYKLQTNDIVSINITSFNKQVSSFYNLENTADIGGFLIKSNGYINIPMVDSIYVLNLTIPELEKELYIALKEQIKEPYIVVRLVNFKLIFLGEIGNPGVVAVKNNSINIFEALALAGNISEMGNNTEVKIVRKQDDNKSYIIKLDLTSKDIIASPYYFLQPNDIIYIEPLRVKTFRTNFQTVASFLGVSTFIIVISNFLVSLSR